MIGNQIMKLSNFLISSILIVLFLSSKLNCEVTISPTSIEGMQGESRNLTVTWTNENIGRVIIHKRHPYFYHAYRVICFTSRAGKCHCKNELHSNIEATCSYKSITWTFPSLESRNNGIHTIELYQDSDRVLKTVTVRVFAKPSNIALKCQQDHCSNIVTCVCEALSRGNPKSRLHWMLQTVDGDKKDLSNYVNTDDFFKHIVSSLKYGVEMEDHGGSVSCVVENELDSIRRESVRVQFYYPPTILSPNNSILTFNELQSIEIKCQANSFPASNLFWIYPNTYHQSKSDLLSITNLTKHDEGTYTCYASNCMGNTTKELQIIVQYPTEDNEEMSVSLIIVSIIILSVFILVSIIIGILLSLHIKEKLPSQCCFKSQLTTNKNIELPKQRYLKLHEDRAENDVDNITAG